MAIFPAVLRLFLVVFFMVSGVGSWVVPVLSFLVWFAPVGHLVGQSILTV